MEANGGGWRIEISELRLLEKRHSLGLGPWKRAPAPISCPLPQETMARGLFLLFLLFWLVRGTPSTTPMGGLAAATRGGSRCHSCHNLSSATTAGTAGPEVWAAEASDVFFHCKGGHHHHSKVRAGGGVTDAGTECRWPLQLRVWALYNYIATPYLRTLSRNPDLASSLTRTYLDLIGMRQGDEGLQKAQGAR